MGTLLDDYNLQYMADKQLDQLAFWDGKLTGHQHHATLSNIHPLHCCMVPDRGFKTCHKWPNQIRRSIPK